MNDTFASFLARAEVNLSRDCAARFACIAVRKDGAWLAIATSVILGPEHALRDVTKLPDLELDELLVFARVLPSSSVRAVLQLVGRGIVEPPLVGLDNTLVLGPVTESGRLSFSLSQFQPGNFHRFEPFGVPFGGYECTASPDHISSVLDSTRSEDVRRRLPTLEVPTQDLPDLARHYGIAAQLEHERRITLISPTWVRFETIEPSPDTKDLQVSVSTKWDDGITKATISYLAANRDSRAARKLVAVTPTESPANSPRESRYGVAAIPWTSAQGPIVVGLNFDGQSVDSTMSGLPNQRILVHDFLDPDLDTLAKHLRPAKTSKASLFEGAVATLFHLCGFSVQRLGGGQVDREIDLIVFDGNAPALFIECTMEPPSQDKIRNLASRASACMSSLGLVLPRGCAAICTPLTSPPDRIDYSNAREARVSLLYALDLEIILEMAQHGHSPVDIVAHVARSAWL